MLNRNHDGLTIAIAFGLILLGAVMIYYTTGDRDPGNLFFPRPMHPAWLSTTISWQETPGFGGLLLCIGLLYLWHDLGGALPGWLRVLLVWGILALLWDLTLYRALGFWTAKNPPWWATVWVGGLTVALTLRRVHDLYDVWRKPVCQSG